jgi:ProP effector
MTESVPQPQATEGPAAKERAKTRPAPRGRKVHPVLEKLFELYPRMFGAQFLPLKLGVFQDLLAAHPDAFKREDLKVALGLHARSTRYLESVAAGHPRCDLQGVPIEPVAPEHVHHAIMEVFRRRQARSAENLRPHVVSQLVVAIEASGLGREDYAQRMRTQDEATNALLDEAIAEVARLAAKREALLRAFEASGRTEAEFADMYGMDPAEVARTLERARADKIRASQQPVAQDGQDGESALEQDSNRGE